MNNGGLNEILARIRCEGTYIAYIAAANHLSKAKTDHLLPLKLAILRDMSIEPLLPVIQAELALAGFDLQLYLSDFDTVNGELFNPDSGLYRFAPDLVVLALWLEMRNASLCSRFSRMNSADAQAEVRKIVGGLQGGLSAFRQKLSAPVILNNFPLPDYPVMGIRDANSRPSHTGTVLELNRELARLAEVLSDVFIVDFMSLFARLGTQQAFDARGWHVGRAPLGRQALVPIGKEYAKFVRALRGRVRKCLVLDCDQTLWGGVVGEDGPDGIHLGTEFPGCWFVEFQQEILNLYDRGVILALCSKNNPEEVLDVLRHHPAMLIKESHLATWQINWDDKVTNLRRIATDLNIGLDSLVFVDDSFAECELVRQQLPEVEVIQLPPEPAEMRRVLLAGGWFDALTISEEDRGRTRMYQEESRRRELRETASSLEEYLTSLELVIEIGEPDAATLARVAQLTQKTNQFNLTTKRYTEAAIADIATGNQTQVFWLRLSDRVADMGIVGVAIVRYQDGIADVDSLLLSCRALGRGVEQALAAHVLNIAQDRGCQYALGHYRATKKNAQVAEFFGSLGFERLRHDELGSDWQIHLENRRFECPPWIKVKRQPSPAQPNPESSLRTSS